jgi:hypothetical protein
MDDPGDRSAISAQQTPITAVVLDANAFGADAAFNVGLLRRLARDAQEQGIQVWLPEPVLWELAAHVADVVEELSSQVRARNKMLARAGLDTVALPAYPDRETVIERIIEEATYEIDGLDVIECSGVAAKEALRDQITGRPPAGVEKGVKTGASDSAWIRSVRKAADDPTNRSYVIVSRDAAVRRAYEHWGEEPPRIFQDIHQLRTDVLGFQPASHEAAMRVAKLADRLVRTEGLLDIVSPESLDLRVLGQGRDAPLGRFDAAETTADVAAVKALVAVDVRTRARDEALTWVDVLADLSLAIAKVDPATGELGRETMTLADVLLRVPLLIDLTDEPKVEIAAAPWVLFSERCWDDLNEAASDCIASLWQVPEFEGAELSDPAPGRPWTAELNDGRTLYIDYGADRHGGWVMRARIDHDEVRLWCHREPRNRECQWTVEVEGDSPLSAHPTFAVGEFVIRKRLDSIRSGRRPGRPAL